MGIKTLTMAWAGPIPPKLPKDDSGSILVGEARNQRLYLDVTDLTNQEIRDAYPTIEVWRRHLELRKRDIRTGRPCGTSTRRALEVVAMANAGIPIKQIARNMGFKVYTSDNPSGSYPLARKYLKIGRDIQSQLGSLKTYLENLDLDQEHETMP